MTMQKNIGSIDRIIRIVAGIGILSLVFIGPETKWGYLGLVLIATGLIGWCPPYQLFGISTCKSNK
jgi:hypothetical protein